MAKYTAITAITQIKRDAGKLRGIFVVITDVVSETIYCN